MAISKLTQYSQNILDISAVHNALGHPARLTIAELLLKGETLTNKNLITILQLSEATVHFHLRKLSRAGLIEIEFHANSGIVKPTTFLAQHLPFISSPRENLYLL